MINKHIDDLDVIIKSNISDDRLQEVIDLVFRHVSKNSYSFDYVRKKIMSALKLSDRNIFFDY
jgi:hypothetical protein